MATNKPASKSTSLATVAQGALPAEIAGMMDEDAGRGVSQSATDVGIPFLGILQDLSPQTKKREEEYIEGAEPGMLVNSQTRAIYPGDEGVLFVPCFFKSALVEWLPNRGGFQAEHPMDSPLGRQVTINDKKERILPNGNSLDETKYYYGFYRDPETERLEAAVVGMSKSMLSCSRDWQGMLKRVQTPSGLQAPSFSHFYRLRSSLRKKNNNEWFVWSIEDAGWADAKTYSLAREMAAQCENGMVRASQPDESATGSSAGVSEEVL